MTHFGLTNPIFNYYGNPSPRVVTAELTAAAVGKRFVSLAAGGSDTMPNIAQTGAGLAAFGVLDGDGEAGDRRAVWQESSGISVTAGAALTAGQAVEADADGQAVPLAAGVKLGTVLSDAALGEDAVVNLSL